MKGAPLEIIGLPSVLPNTRVITFNGATGENKINIPDNLADALSILEGANPYLTFVTTDAQAEIVFNQAGNDVDFRVEGDTDPATLFVDANADAVIIGGGASPAIINSASDFEVQGDAGVITLIRQENDALAPELVFYKSVASGIVTSGDNLGIIQVRGHDGNDNATLGARIDFTSTGTIAENQIPTNMLIKLANASGTLTTVWTFLSGGVLEANGAQSITTGGNALLTGDGGTAGFNAKDILLVNGNEISDSSGNLTSANGKVSFSGTVTSITVVNGIVTAAS